MKMLLWISCCFLALVSAVAPAKIVFYTSHGGNYEIYAMNDDGSHIRNLTNSPFFDGNPRWSPDGKQIAFARRPGQKHVLKQLFLMNADGSNVRQLTHPPEAAGANLTYAPDGKRIAFVSVKTGMPEINVLDIASGTVKQLTSSKVAMSVDPNWSPDGKRIVYRYGHRVRGEAIYTMSADGTNQKPLVRPKLGALLRFSPAWAPDSQRVVYCEMEWATVNGALVNTVSDLVIRDTRSNRQERRAFPSGLQSARWISNQEILLGAREDKSDKPDIYRYHIPSGRVVNLTNTPEIRELSPQWRDDNAWAVSSAGRKPIQWGKVKSGR